ncbi:MAG: hypothetical protein LC104_00650 [Bacteroidales bacterium]|nr:hypothetical protein [Bacteroidales bacterium]
MVGTRFRGILIGGLLSGSVLAADPSEALRQVQAERIRTAEELFSITAKLYAGRAVSAMDYQNARLRMLAVKIDAARTAQERLQAMRERVDACQARLGYLTTPGIALSPIEAEGVIPVALVELAEARFAITERRDDREAIVTDTLRELDQRHLDPKVETALTRTEKLELQLVRLALKARLLSLLND